MTEAGPRRGKFGDLGPRVVSGLAMAALALLLVWLGDIWLAFGAAAASALMLWELRRIVTGEGDFAEPRMLLLGGGGALAVLAAWGVGAAVAFAILYAAAAAVFLVEAPSGKALLAAGLVYLASAMAFLVAMRAGPDGFARVVWLVLIVIAADVCAYFTGRALGGRKLWPAVSPGKTWSGALGGLAGAVVVAVGFAATQGWSLPRAGLLGAGIAVASQAGDLLESAVKRRYGVKDASGLIPGHGGVMDRLDAVMGGLWFFALWGIAGGTAP